jgi:FAD/FMN-containing dehydrogenase
VLWALDAELRTKGRALPVINDGYAGPSVGGYLAAGGFGPGSSVAGGFWDNVAEITLVNGEGQVQRLLREAPLFPWLFGSMGQLGIIVEAKLDILAYTTAKVTGGSEPFTMRGAGVLSHNRLSPSPMAPDEAGRLFWFTLFVPESNLDEARAQLDTLECRHTGTFAFRNRYVYFIAHRRLAAPLLWPHSTSYYAIGSWGILNDTTARGIENVLAFDADFMKIVFANGYRRYVQSELPSGPDLYERYFGPAVYNRFRALKQVQDPRNLLNRGWVFE